MSIKPAGWSATAIESVESQWKRIIEVKLSRSTWAYDGQTEAKMAISNITPGSTIKMR
jgi:hypothetical protein